jgi:folate-binding Fe-S cluster repair protein YgfZ
MNSRLSNLTTTDIKAYLEKELPDFTYIAGTDTKHEQNWNSIIITREGKELILDVSKVDTEDALEKLKAYVSDLWKRDGKVIDA